MRTKIIYEDEAILVIHKPAGFPVQTKGVGNMDCVCELKNYLKKQSLEKISEKTPNKKIPREPYLGIIHRLDQPVEGLMVFAKTQKAAATLSAQVSGADDSRMVKCYKARVFGHLPEKKGELTDYLTTDNKTNMSYVVEEKDSADLETEGKESILEYRVEFEDAYTQELYIHLHTGRHHQIRVQLSHAGVPILGDQKYGTEDSIEYSRQQGIRNVCLRAVNLQFKHPTSGEWKEWEII